MVRVFVAGATGTIGAPLVRALVARGYEVSALTRSAGKRGDLSALGAQPVVADALDRHALVSAVAAVRPTHVIRQLTALPRDGPSRAADVAATNRLRSAMPDGCRSSTWTRRSTRRCWRSTPRRPARST